MLQPVPDPHDVSLHLVTMAGTEYIMQANLNHYEDITQLEDDILCFLPTVSTLDVFGCEVDLIELDTQLPLSDTFHTVLLQQRKLQIIVRPCMEEGHSIWQFQEADRQGYPKAVHVPTNPRKAVEDRAFYAAPMLRHVKVAEGIQHKGFAAWQGCQQLQIVKLPPSVISLEDGAFQGCYVLREIVAPGCVQYSRRVFAERCSLSKLAPVRAQTTAIFWHQEHSWADMLLKAASRPQPSHLHRTRPAGLERCLMAHFAVLALSTSASL